MKQADFDKISEIAARYGFAEWALVGFTKKRDYTVFSYFTDSSIMPIFKIVLGRMVKTVEEYIRKDRKGSEETLRHVGRC